MAFDSFYIKQTSDDSIVDQNELDKQVCEHFGLDYNDKDYGHFFFTESQEELRSFQKSISWAGLIHTVIYYSSIEYGKRSRYEFLGAFEYIRDDYAMGTLPPYRQHSWSIRFPKSAVLFLMKLLAFFEDNGYYVFVRYPDYFVQDHYYPKVIKLAEDALRMFVEKENLSSLTHSQWSNLIEKGFPVIITEQSYKGYYIDASALDITPLAEKIALKLLNNMETDVPRAESKLSDFAYECMSGPFTKACYDNRPMVNKRDPIEYTPIYEQIKDSLEKDLDRQLSGNPRKGRLGFCHEYWRCKKKILKEKYGIDWKSPAEMNPDTYFD